MNATVNAEAVKRLAQEQGIDVRELAERAGLTPVNLRCILAGSVRANNIRIAQLARALNVSDDAIRAVGPCSRCGAPRTPDGARCTKCSWKRTRHRAPCPRCRGPRSDDGLTCLDCPWKRRGRKAKS